MQRSFRRSAHNRAWSFMRVKRTVRVIVGPGRHCPLHLSGNLDAVHEHATFADSNCGEIGMTLADLASIGSLISGVAVLISLIYLALQVRQAEKNQRALMNQGTAARVSD